MNLASAKPRLFYMIFVFQFSVLFSQEVSKYDSILKTENLEFHSKEIRVYKNFSTSTGLELFRMFYDENDKINIEFYETIAGKTADGKLLIKVRNQKLNSLKNPEYIWLELIHSNIMYIPDFDKIEYKLNPKAEIFIDEKGELAVGKIRAIFIDGENYFIQIKNNGDFKNLEYPDPESYLKKFPDVDELIIFNDFLNIIKEEFNVLKK